MKICTITCHDVYNHGASLQAYALQTYLASLGHDVSIIDYKPDYLSGHFRLDAVGNPKYDKPFVRQMYLAAKLPGRLRVLPRKKAFDSFTEKYLHLTKRYGSFEELKLDPPEADIYFAGSDQIWNPLFKNGRDPAFYLDFVRRGVRASYAASFAVDSFPPELADAARAYLNNFDYISVREKTGLDILKSLGIDFGCVVPDPVFLLSRDEWSALVPQCDKAVEPYLLVYDFDRDPLVRSLARKISKERGLRIFSVFDESYADKCFPCAGPERFLELVRNASFVISNSFHATAFSMIFERDFAVTPRREKINTRMTDLCERAGVAGSVARDGNFDFSDIDFDKINKHLLCEKQRGTAYIGMVLEETSK